MDASVPDAAVLPALLSRIAVLPTSKQRVMLALLAAVEKEADTTNWEAWISAVLCAKESDTAAAVATSSHDASACKTATEHSPAPESAKGAEPHPPLAAEKFEIPTPQALPLPSPQPADVSPPVTIKIFSSHSTNDVIGLTELEFLDSHENRIPVPASCLSLSGPALTSSDSSLGALVDAHPNTTEDVHMWRAGVPSHAVVAARVDGSPLAEITVDFTGVPQRPCKLVVWNYNRSAFLCGIGVKDVEVWMAGRLAWKGALRKGSGRVGGNAFTSIPLPAPAPPPPQQQLQPVDAGGAVSASAGKVSSGPSASTAAADTASAAIVTPSGLGGGLSTARRRSSSRGSVGMWLDGGGGGDVASNVKPVFTSSGNCDSSDPSAQLPSARPASAQKKGRRASASGAAPPCSTDAEHDEAITTTSAAGKAVHAPASTGTSTQSDGTGSSSTTGSGGVTPSSSSSSSTPTAVVAAVVGIASSEGRKVVVAHAAKPNFNSDVSAGGSNSSFASRLAAIPAAPRYDKHNSSSSSNNINASATTTDAVTSSKSSGSSGYTPSLIEKSATGSSGSRRGSVTKPAASLQDSWNSLDFFQRTNRGRISMLPNLASSPTAGDGGASTAAATAAPHTTQAAKSKIGEDSLDIGDDSDDNDDEGFDDSLQILSSSLFAPVMKPLDGTLGRGRLGTGSRRTAATVPATTTASSSHLPLPSAADNIYSGSDSGDVAPAATSAALNMSLSAALEDGMMTGGKVALAGMLAMMEEHAKLTADGGTKTTSTTTTTSTSDAVAGALTIAKGGARTLPLPMLDDSMQRFVDELGLDASQIDPSHLLGNDVSTVDIPEMPSGRVLCIRIYSTWGDPHYVGLAGLDFYDAHGNAVEFANRKASIRADPADVNVLPGYGGDPRTVDNLLDGVNHTCDDLHVWLAPFTPGKVNVVTVTFDGPTALSMVRVWNYNKSRIHSYRGARLVSIELDGVRVFEGEVRKAVGAVAPIEQCSEVILFTNSEGVLRTIEAQEVARVKASSAAAAVSLTSPFYGSAAGSADGGASTVVDVTAEVLAQVAQQLEEARPRTGGGGSRRGSRVHANPHVPYEEVVGVDAATVAASDRPRTSAVLSTPPLKAASSATASSSTAETPAVGRSKSLANMHGPSGSSASYSGGGSASSVYAHPLGASVQLAGLPLCRSLHFDLLSTWGDQYYAGLSGLEVWVAEPSIGGSSSSTSTGILGVFPLTMACVRASPRDINQDGHVGDQRTLDKLIDGVNVTTDDTHMWLIPFTPGGRHTLDIDLGKQRYVYAIRVWNYNKSSEDVCRGVRQARLSLDGSRLGGGGGCSLYIRPAPGHALFDYGQMFVLSASSSGGSTSASGTVQLKPEFGALSMSSMAKGLAVPRPFERQSVQQDYETPLLPSGCMFKFVFWTSHGDLYYVGLDGIGLFDAGGRRVPIQPRHIHALPESVNVLPGSGGGDVRVPGNLAKEYDPKTWRPNDSWLAPLSHSLRPGSPNLLYITLDQPITLSMLKVWNYSKDPGRGVASMEMWMDEVLVYCGEVAAARGTPAHAARAAHTVLFTNDPATAAQQKQYVTYCGSREQDVVCINEGRQTNAMRPKLDPTAHGVVIDLSARPTTAIGHA